MGKILSFALIFLLFSFFSFPRNESVYLSKINFSLSKIDINDAISFTFSSPSQLTYNIFFQDNKAILALPFIESYEAQISSMDLQNLFTTKHLEHHNHELLITISMQHYPYVFFESCETMRSHQILFQAFPFRILNGKRIIIDPGHGAFDEETHSIYDPGSIQDELIESEVNLLLSLKLKERLEKRGAEVILTREKEYDRSNLRLFQRIVMSNDWKPDVFLSIHQNESEYSYANGIFIYYHHEESIPLAQKIMLQLSLHADLKQNHILNDPLQTLKSLEINKALLIECAFLSSHLDQEKYREPNFIDRLAEGIEMGLVKYFEKKQFHVE